VLTVRGCSSPGSQPGSGRRLHSSMEELFVGSAGAHGQRQRSLSDSGGRRDQPHRPRPNGNPHTARTCMSLARQIPHSPAHAHRHRFPLDSPYLSLSPRSIATPRPLARPPPHSPLLAPSHLFFDPSRPPRISAPRGPFDRTST
jgi:hypothetical protein